MWTSGCVSQHHPGLFDISAAGSSGPNRLLHTLAHTHPHTHSQTHIHADMQTDTNTHIVADTGTHTSLDENIEFPLEYFKPFNTSWKCCRTYERTGK